MDESKAIPAEDVVNNPADVLGFTQRYIMLREQNFMRVNYTHTIQAINVLAAYGWEPAQITYDSTNNIMFTLMENLHHKRKNEA